MLDKNKITVLKSRELEFEDLLRKTAELLRKEMQGNGQPVTAPRKHSSAA